MESTSESIGSPSASVPVTDAEPGLSSLQVTLLAFGAGALVANIYYSQPLLSAIASDFRISVSAVGTVAMLSQLGTAAGMFAFVPMGDTKERRGLIVRLVLAASLTLILMATVRNFWWLTIASFGVGLTGSVVHVIVPYAAHLALPARRGATIGAVLSGLLLGILLARTVSGFAGAWLGWRAMYWIAAGLMLVVAALFQSRLPKSGPVVQMSWWTSIRSTVQLMRTFPTLREAAILGGVFFSCFSAFWTTLVFFLRTPPYHYGSAVAGSFGLVGAAGAAGAPLIGRIADRYGARRNVLIGLLTALCSFFLLYFLGQRLWGLIVAVILLDLGVQAGHVSNQTRIYSLAPEARSRLNMVYMVCYFVAGAAGSYVGTILWTRFGWSGVCFGGIGILLLGLLIYIGSSRNSNAQDRTAT
jgi:predicted MFS family arabinose efflux permease